MELFNSTPKRKSASVDGKDKGQINPIPSICLQACLTDIYWIITVHGEETFMVHSISFVCLVSPTKTVVRTVHKLYCQ